MYTVQQPRVVIVCLCTLACGEQCEANVFGSVCLSGFITQKLLLRMT